jgi:hypothetical protein
MTAGCEHIMAHEFEAWLSLAKPGERIVYATGILGHRTPGFSRTTPARRNWRRYSATREGAREAEDPFGPSESLAFTDTALIGAANSGGASPSPPPSPAGLHATQPRPAGQTLGRGL